jgi:hypothetical protein
MCVGHGNEIPSAKVVRREKVENETAGETCAGVKLGYSIWTHVQPVIYSAILTVTPLSLQALEFERTRLVSFYSSFAYSEMAEAIPLIDSQLTNRVS